MMMFEEKDLIFVRREILALQAECAHSVFNLNKIIIQRVARCLNIHITKAK